MTAHSPKIIEVDRPHFFFAAKNSLQDSPTLAAVYAAQASVTTWPYFSIHLITFRRFFIVATLSSFLVFFIGDSLYLASSDRVQQCAL